MELNFHVLVKVTVATPGPMALSSPERDAAPPAPLTESSRGPCVGCRGNQRDFWAADRRAGACRRPGRRREQSIKHYHLKKEKNTR